MFHSVKTRTLVTFLAVVVLIIIIATAGAFSLIKKHEDSISSTEGTAASQACASIVELSIENLDEFKPGTEDYNDCRDAMRTLCKNTGMTYMYAYILDPEANSTTYIMVAGASDAQDAYIMKERPYGTVVKGTPEQSELDALEGKPTPEAIEYNNQFGHMLDWVALVDQEQKIIAGASYSFSDQRRVIFFTTLSVVVPFILILFLLLAIQLFTLQRHVMKPLNLISERMMHFSAGKARSYEHLGITSKDELGKIARAFDGMVDEIGIYLEDIETMTAAKVQNDVELNVAYRIQQGMVPARTSVSGVTADVNAFSRPAREIGGDFYEIVEMSDGALSIIIGDVSGKGVAAALFMSMSKEMIRIELTTGKGPAETLRSVNEHLCTHNPEGMFVTAFIATLKTDGSVVFANAGHLPPVIIGENATVLPCMSGCLLGLFEDAEIENEQYELDFGETILLYTDGACEAVNAKREFLGDAAIVDSLSCSAPFADPCDVIGGLVGTVDGFAAQSEQFDDLTAIAMMRRSGANHEITSREEISLKTVDVALSSFNLIKRDVMNGPEQAARLRACLACEEIFANIVSYSGASCIFFDVTEKEGRLIVILGDDGTPFDPLMAGPIEKDFEDLDSGGMGISLVKSIASELSYKRRAGRNVLTMAFDLHE